MAVSGIFCLEGEWSSKLTDRTSVRPQLDMLTPLGVTAPLIHRDVATREEFFYYCDKWTQKQYANYRLGYFAFHGTEACINLGKQDITLEEIGAALGKKAAGKTLYFGSCLTMAAPDKELSSFVKQTGVRALVGYTKEVDWIQAAAFDFILLPMLLDRAYPRTVYTSLARDHAGFVRGLGFRLITKDFISPRKAARSAAGLN
jgi:hypothetical protein